MIIVLLGYMASGKSLIGKKLAELLDMSYIDLDSFIEEHECLAINEIFKQKGEIYFRKKERESLKLILDNKSNSILSLGGGTPCYGDNMALINSKPNSKSIYLDVSLPTLVKRLAKEKEKRPLVAHLDSTEALQEFVGKHLFERVIYYKQASLKIKADTSLKSIIESIILELF